MGTSVYFFRLLAKVLGSGLQCLSGTALQASMAPSCSEMALSQQAFLAKSPVLVSRQTVAKRCWRKKVSASKGPPEQLGASTSASSDSLLPGTVSSSLDSSFDTSPPRPTGSFTTPAGLSTMSASFSGASLPRPTDSSTATPDLSTTATSSAEVLPATQLHVTLMECCGKSVHSGCADGGTTHCRRPSQSSRTQPVTSGLHARVPLPSG
eukprot:CAMPEP_0171164732 /NCGR_PEP_ID=MMETSP0790-20130122/5821_1 /TAXON_ID=2925 /ORGANISM="Alexandrium catenella, Strain OF101" /LENGTH=208 /DNA_ID=CAMNT_0011629499 /DNA_START=218 /DNA_END=840 /DNA_ORIENTATION=-